MVLDRKSKVLPKTNAEKKLIFAVRRNDPQKIVEAVNEGADIDATQNNDGFCAVIFAVRCGSYDAVEMLVELGADIEQKNNGWDAYGHAHGFLRYEPYKKEVAVRISELLTRESYARSLLSSPTKPRKNRRLG